jgi:hypothetical protein
MIALKKQPGPVRSFETDLQGYAGVASHYAGSQTVPVERIVGSVGRAHELRSDFLPVRKAWGFPRSTARYRRIRRLMSTMESVTPEDLYDLWGRYYDQDGSRGAGPRPLPPVELNRLGEVYYVVDGHHRVAAVRSLGQLEIDAVVTEYVPAAGAQSQIA